MGGALALDHDSPAPAVARAAKILTILAEDPRRPVRLSELSRRVVAAKSSVANVCAALEEARLVDREGGGFVLGRRVVELGAAYLASVDIVRQFHRSSEGLTCLREETVQLAVLEGMDVIYLARHDGLQPIKLASEVGRRLPASCTAIGKALLASLDESVLTERLKGVSALPVLTSLSHKTPGSLLIDLGEVRHRGFAVDNEETMEGVVCLGVAIPGVGGGPYGVSVTIVKGRLGAGRLEALAAELIRLRALVSNPFLPA